LTAIPPPAGKVGSGKFGTPCVRMQCAKVNAFFFWLAETGGGAVPPPNSLHALTAASNAGPPNVVPSMVIVELSGEPLIEKPPAAFGSGKFGTP